jgi:methionyl-tRNA formyltransferase
VRTAFFGTPEIAVPALKALAETTELVAVVCQPDRPSGRGMTLSAPPVKRAALELGVEVHQPVKVKTGTLHEWLAERRIDAVVVLAYGRILPPPVLEAPPHGCINLHASLLPRYRGAAPINWAIIRGETETGVSLMRMDAGLDTGPVFMRRPTPIGPETTAGELTEAIAELSATVVREDLPRVLAGELAATPQDEALATLAPPITKDMTRVDWSQSAGALHDFVRGLAPRPSAMTTAGGKVLKLHRLRPDPEGDPDATPGTVLSADKRGVRVATGGGSVWLLSAQPEGRKPQGGADLVNGRVLRAGDVLGEAPKRP